MRHLFDVRNIIGGLLGIYGVVLTIAGFAPGLLREHEEAQTENLVDLYIGTEANWWVGLILIGVAIVFIAWALLRPVEMPETAPPAEPAQPSGPATDSEH